MEQGGAGDRAGTCAGAGTGTDAGQDANVSVRGLVEKGGQDSIFSGGWPKQSDNSGGRCALDCGKGACVTDNQQFPTRVACHCWHVWLMTWSRGACKVPSISSPESCMIRASLQQARARCSSDPVLN